MARVRKSQLNDHKRMNLIESESETEKSPAEPCYKCLRPGHFGDNCKFIEIPNLNTCSLTDIVIRTTRITLQGSACVLFMMLYQLMKYEKISSLLVLECCWSSAIIGQLIFQFQSKPTSWELIKENGITQIVNKIAGNEHFRVTMFYVFSAFFFAPVWRTLTQTICSDTLHATSNVFLFAHLLTNDYGIPGFLVSRTISINAAIMAAICLSSRLPTNQHSIALITLAVQSFVLFPIFSSIIWESSLWMSAVVLGVSFICFLDSVQAFIVYVGSVAFIMLVLPLLFAASQQFKYNLIGPWDEAVVKKDNYSNVK